MKNVKKIISLLVVLAMLLTVLSSCSSILDGITDSIIQNMIPEDLTRDTEDTDESDITGNDTSSEETRETNSSTETRPVPDHIYIDFTPSEKNMFINMLGETIPFIPNDEYYVEAYSNESEIGIHFYTIGNTPEEYEAYLVLFESLYNVAGSYGADPETWYIYDAGNFNIDMSYYISGDLYYVDIYAYIFSEETTVGSHTYTDFTEDEKQLFIDLFGETIPFAPNNEYYVEEYTYDTEVGISFYTVGNTQTEYDAYLEVLNNAYIYLNSYEDEYGDTWYTYGNDEYYIDGYYYIDICYYYYDNVDAYIIDIYAYVPSEGETSGEETTEGTYTYTDFTENEKQAFVDLLGDVIPFIPNNEYYAEAYAAEYDDYDESGINFYTFGNTQAEFDAYLGLFDVYTLDSTYYDDYNDIWYVYDAGSFYIDISYYETDQGYCVDVYAYVLVDKENTSNTEGTEGTEGDYTYTDFTEDEKQAFINLLGGVIPFAPNNEYYVEEYTYDTEVGLNFYSIGNTQAEYEAYLEVLKNTYIYLDLYEDEYGDTWYTYGNDEYYIDICYYYYDSVEAYIIDLYAYIENGSGDGTGGEENSDVITNNGAGLPAGTDGVYDVNFKDAANVKDVTNQGYYLDGCPTSGSPAVLVIPVQFSDITAESKGYTIDKIQNAFLQDGATDYYSVYDFYYISSYNQLTLDITVLDSWFTPANSSTYYANATMDYYGYETEIGDQIIMDEALQYLDAQGYDLSRYDSDGNGIIDAVVMITTLDIDYNYNFNWAYRYWNIYTDDQGYYYEYDGVSANDYIWASYGFLHETFDASGNASYDDTTAVNTYTYIHEFGHILGADDYYDTSGIGSPMGGFDVMDAMAGDHNPYTKFNYGWITTSKLITTDSSLTLTLKDFTTYGETFIIANNWDEALGAYQEYYIVAYYKSTGLNAGENAGYFSRDGIVVYHVNASLYTQVSDGVTYYDVYYNNTDASDQYGTSENLIEYVMHYDAETGGDVYTYIAGDSLPSTTDDQGNTLGYTFTVDELIDEYATITFSKIA